MIRRTQFALLLPLLAALTQPACSHARSSTTSKKVIVLGIDGMDPQFLGRHWESLPNLDRLRRQGEFRRLATTIPPQSPVAWSTFITGMDPGGHGIYDFVHRDPQKLLPFSSMAEISAPGRTFEIGPWVLPLSKGHVHSFRRGTAFWKILAARGVPVNILRMPTNFPPVECEGESLAGMGTPDLRGTFGTFTFFTDHPEEKRREVPGGEIVAVKLENYHATLRLEGPPNTLRKQQPKTAIGIEVDVDPAAPAARFAIGDVQLILREGEWSGWIKVRFPLMPLLQHARGMFRIYAKKLRQGFQVYVSPINIDPEDPELPISEPASYSRTLARSVGPFFTQGIAEDTAALRQGVLSRQEYLAQSRLVAEEHLALLRYGVTHLKSGLLFFHFFGVDQNSHLLWGKYERELLETYQRVDQEIGWVMAQAPDATLIVMSDHGFTAFDRAVHVNAWLRKEGFLKLTDDMAGDEELFPYVDWANTQAYSLGLNGLYLNLAGRERYGVIKPGPQADAVLKKLSEKLLEFRDPDTGEPVVDTVYRPAQQFQGGALAAAPDLIVGYRPGYRSSWQTALGAVPKAIVVPNTEAWVGDHCIAARFVPGLLLANRRSRVEDPQLADLPVTLLAEFGAPRAEGMVGRPIY